VPFAESSLFVSIADFGLFDIPMSVTFGVRAHDFGKLPVERMAEKIAMKGLDSIQLAPVKALVEMTGDWDLSEESAARVREIFGRRGIRVAVLGCYINPIHPDLHVRATEISRFKKHIRVARDFGCGLVATETGTCNPDGSFHPDNHGDEAFVTLLRSIGELVAEAEKFNVTVCIEGVIKHVIASPRRMKRMLNALSSQHVKVLFDPVNLLDLDNCDKQDRMIEEAFDLFGERIAVVHAKDFLMESKTFSAAAVGKGRLNYQLLARLLKARCAPVDILLEETTELTIDDSVEFLKKLFR
jgi:L-ribulose-5-phosphate 3-epimerase